MSSDKHDLLKVAVACGVGGVTLLFHSLNNFRKARMIEDVARIDIASAAMGMVEIEGYAWPGRTAMRAACGREVVHYNYKVQKYVKRGKNSSWETQYEYTFDEPFYAIDGTGVCLVNPRESSLEVREVTYSLSGYATEPAELSKLIGKNSGWFSPSYRLIERKIFSGSPLYVCGDLQPVSANELRIRSGFVKFLERAKALNMNPVFRMQKLDYNKDGKVTDEEELIGFSDTSKETETSLQEAIKIAGAIVHSGNHPLLIADCHQTQLLNRLKSYNSLKIIVGIVLITLGLYFGRADLIR